MQRIQGIRGFQDRFGQALHEWESVETHLADIARGYAYDPIQLPYLESTALFQRSVGETSDIVQKEMYSFVDKNDTSVSLRPEGTASCVRICIEHNLLYGSTQKLFYLAPMFRRERPQKGRFRQFHQFGIEAYGYPEGFIELEQQLLLQRVWQTLAVPTPTLQTNYLGSHETRLRYKSALQAFYGQYAADFDTLTRERLANNPLRILDSKDPHLIAINQDAPRLADHLADVEKRQYDSICSQLAAHGISAQHNDGLVRGLDYYSGFIYEYTSEHLGAQSSVCGGGRYDNLFAELGAKPVSATGFSIGLERLIDLVDFSRTPVSRRPKLVWISLSQQALAQSQQFCERLRTALPHWDIHTLSDLGKISALLKKAEKARADYAILCGDDELSSETFACKDLHQRSQESLSLPAIIDHLLKAHP